MTPPQDISAPRSILPPCAITGKPCDWRSEEWYGEDGEMESWDNYCGDCLEWRDWSKDECEAEGGGR